MVFNFHDGDQNTFQAMSVSEWQKTGGLRNFVSELYNEAKFPVHENFGSYWSANSNSVEELAEKEYHIPAIYVELESDKIKNPPKDALS